MLYYESPNDVPKTQLICRPSIEKIFLAGGITNVWDWQAEAVNRLSVLNDHFLIMNPRRKDFAAFKETARYQESKDQILWERRHREHADQMIFWFSHETVHPIALFELGVDVAREYYDDRGGPVLFVGVDPRYERKFDLSVQLPSFFLDIVISDTLDGLLNRVINYNTVLAKEQGWNVT